MEIRNLHSAALTILYPLLLCAQDKVEIRKILPRFVPLNPSPACRSSEAAE